MEEMACFDTANNAEILDVEDQERKNLKKVKEGIIRLTKKSLENTTKNPTQNLERGIKQEPLSTIKLERTELLDQVNALIVRRLEWLKLIIIWDMSMNIGLTLFGFVLFAIPNLITLDKG